MTNSPPADPGGQLEEPKMYTGLAGLWPLISPPEEYRGEAELYRRLLVDACELAPRSVLELGSGGGNNASHLKAHFDMLLVDLSPAMLEVSRRLNPECEHVQGDMRTVRLGREFDAVFVHDAVVYMTTAEDLRRAIETAYVHCRPGGAALFAPDHVRDTFRSATGSGGHDGERISVRYLEWSWDPDPGDSSYLVDYVYLVRDAGGDVRVIHDRHVEGLFSREEWVRQLSDVGFEPTVHEARLADVEPGTYEIFVARKPASDATMRIHREP